jgi:hypothetical protein
LTLIYIIYLLRLNAELPSERIEALFIDMKALDNIVNILNDMLKEDKKEKYPYHSYATARYVINYAEFSVWVDSSFVDVCVVSDRGFEYPNIEKYISDRIVDYDSIEVCDEDEWNLNGFRDESDYLNYKYG